MISDLGRLPSDAPLSREAGKSGQEKNRGTAVVPTRVGEAESSGARQTIQLKFDSGPTGQLTDSSEEPMPVLDAIGEPNHEKIFTFNPSHCIQTL